MAYVGFNKLKGQLAGQVRDPGAVAASIGRKKYGKRKFQKAAAKGQKLRHATPRDRMIAEFAAKHRR